MEPGGESALAAKAADLAKQLDEDFLCEVFGFGDVLRHAQAEGVDSSVMTLVELFEGSHIASRGRLRQRMIRRLLNIYFDIGAVSDA
jgi:hypothetical protein